MATDTYLLDRIKNITKKYPVKWTEKRMFGGDCFMVDDKMCFGTYKGGLMVRVDPNESDELCKRTATEVMIHGGRPMAGFLFVEAEGYDSDDDLEFWIKKSLEYNPKAKSSKKKK